MAQGMINYITVHCSATQPKQDIGAKEIDIAHKQRGFARIGYHYVIRRNGAVEKGREEDAVGAHVHDHNTGNLGVCLVGGVDANGKAEDNFTLDQKHSLAVLLMDLLKRYPKAEILGHRDWPDVRKDCPCFDVRSWWHETVAAPEL